jgi:hypothetical protein
LILARREWWLLVEGGLNLMGVGGGTRKGDNKDEGVTGARRKEVKPT